MKMSIKTFVERFKRGDFNYSSRIIQCEAGWYDWFCKDSSLAGKTKKLHTFSLRIIVRVLVHCTTIFLFATLKVVMCCFAHSTMKKVVTDATKHIGSCMTPPLELKKQI